MSMLHYVMHGTPIDTAISFDDCAKRLIQRKSCWHFQSFPCRGVHREQSPEPGFRTELPRAFAALVQADGARLPLAQPLLLWLAGPVTSAWVLVGEFIFTLAMALKCYPLQPGGLLVLEALLLGLATPRRSMRNCSTTSRCSCC